MTSPSRVSHDLANAPSAMSSESPGLELIGPIVRLQVQTHSLKRGERPRSWYEPGAILSLNAVRIDAGGVTGVDDATFAEIGDVHHRGHPASKYRGENAVSLGFTSHYGRMRDRFGAHVIDGIAGENIIVETDRIVSADDLDHGVVIVTGEGPVPLGSAEIAKPCVEFSKFCAGYAPDQLADSVITETLQFLYDGTRGFYVTYEQGGPRQIELRVGNLVYRSRAPAS